MNRFFRAITTASWFILSYVAIAGESPEAIPLPLKITAQLDSVDRNHCDVRFTITNAGEKPIQLWHTAVPWKRQQSILVVLYDIKSHQVLVNPLLHWDGVRYHWYDLEPNESIDGVVDLRWFYEKIGDVLKNSDVIMFWSYPECAGVPRDRESGRLLAERQGGWLLIPRLKNSPEEQKKEEPDKAPQ